MKKLTLLLSFLGALTFSQAQSQDQESSNDSITNFNTIILKFGTNLVDSSGEQNPFMLPVAKRRKEDLVSFLNIR
jgi:hypothetical protein